MITKSIKILFTIIMLCFSVEIFANGGEENFEDYYIQINVKSLKDDFFMIKYDSSSEEVYVGLNSLFYFMELYSLEVDIERKRVSGSINKQPIDVKFGADECRVMESELYVKLPALKEKLNFKSANFSMDSLKINLEPNFELPYEEREKGKIERLRLDQSRQEEEEKIDMEMPRKFATPGLLKLEYTLPNVEEAEHNLNFEYASQFLYGELYLSGTVKPEEELEYGNLTYSNIVNDNDLVLGHFDMIVPSFLSIDSKVLGVSFDNNDTYVTRDGGETVIKGEARDADVVELYRNAFLLDYKNFGDQGFTNENFEFRLDDGSLNSDYTLKIYYKDGNIEERRVYSLSDTDVLTKGKSRISVQAGKSDETEDKQGIGKFFYGVTDNVTLGVGGMNLISQSGRKYEILENDFIFKTGAERFPLLLQYKNFYEYQEKENNFEFTAEQKILEYNLKYIKNKYSRYIYEDGGTKEYESISLGKSFKRNSVEFGFSRSVEFYEDEESSYKSIYGLLESYALYPLNLSLKVEQSIDEDDEKEIEYNPYISYVGSNGMSVIGEAIITEREDADDRYREEYSLRFNLRRQKFFDGKAYADFGFKIQYDDEKKKPTYGITFSIEFDDLLYGRVNTDTRIDESGKETTTSGLYLSKIVDLSNPARQIKKNISLSNSWVHGKVFLDKNNNGIFDEGEQPLSDVGVRTNNMTFVTDKNGNYVAEGLFSDDIIEIGIDRKTIDPMTKYMKGALKIKVRKSAGMRVDIPISIVSMITGNIWNTEDFTEREFIQHLTMITILLEKDGEVVDEIDPEFDGMFFFEDVASGKYKIRFQYLGQDNISFSQQELEVDVKLSNTEEGEYFEGFDTEMIRAEEDKEMETIESEDEDITDLIGDF